ncbi:hypothetical protein BV898_15734 [Hypsibius exemplaris]|uniref:Uncharacterized protein n=1 Tax=Hypsibius exemplaris TaxID=2072580 RepID=A0A9X6NBP6_HYPEX|nr:hypothetical protein BV898_15734 [Hypsibius exemplaris]
MKVPPGNQPVKIVTTPISVCPDGETGHFSCLRLRQRPDQQGRCSLSELRFCGLTLSGQGSVTSVILTKYPPPGATTNSPSRLVMQENVPEDSLDWGRKAAHLPAFGFEHEETGWTVSSIGSLQILAVYASPAVTSEDVWCFRRCILKIHPEQHGAYI